MVEGNLRAEHAVEREVVEAQVIQRRGDADALGVEIIETGAAGFLSAGGEQQAQPGRQRRVSQGARAGETDFHENRGQKWETGVGTTGNKRGGKYTQVPP